MAELIQNSSATTLNGTINNVVTSLTVTNGAVFPATGNFRILIDSELMLCTARASNVLTVTRGVESTSGAGHTTGAAVTHVLTTLALQNYVAEHSISQTIADAKGDIITATAADTLVRKAVGANATVLMADSTQSDGLIWGGTWQAYTPAWTSSGTAPALGNGTIAGRYVQFGKTILGRALLTIGSTTTMGTGQYFFSVPVTSADAGVAAMVYGPGAFVDTSAAAIYGCIVCNQTTTTVAAYTDAQPGVGLSGTVPVTWATGDTLGLRFMYEAA